MSKLARLSGPLEIVPNQFLLKSTTILVQRAGIVSFLILFIIWSAMKQSDIMAGVKEQIRQQSPNLRILPQETIKEEYPSVYKNEICDLDQ